MTDQQRIARWMGWTQDAARPEYWYTRDDPGHEGEPRRLPDLTTFIGRAEWCALIKAELRQRDYNTRLNLTKLTVTCALYDDGYVVAGGRELTELAALTAAVLALMESEK